MPTNQRNLIIKRLVFCSVALALAFVTSMVKIFVLPMGGAVTLFSMLFIVLIGNWYGCTAGILTGLALGFLEFLMEPVFLSFMQVCLDYLLAFGALGLSGLFRNQKQGLIKGYIFAVLMRGAFASAAGYAFWMSYIPDDFPKAISFLYPVVYNYSYILAEGIITVIVISIPAVSKAINLIRKTALSET